MAASTLSLCTVFLTVASFWQTELVSPLTAFGSVLGLMAGANYTAQRFTAGKKNDP